MGEFPSPLKEMSHGTLGKEEREIKRRSHDTREREPSSSFLLVVQQRLLHVPPLEKPFGVTKLGKSFKRRRKITYQHITNFLSHRAHTTVFDCNVRRLMQEAKVIFFFSPMTGRERGRAVVPVEAARLWRAKLGRQHFR